MVFKLKRNKIRMINIIYVLLSITMVNIKYIQKMLWYFVLKTWQVELKN